MSAILNLFCGILLDPNDNTVQDDIGLIKTTPNLLRTIWKQNKTIVEESYLESIEGFISELVRLSIHTSMKAI
jgi:hypothetical protein